MSNKKEKELITKLGELNNTSNQAFSATVKKVDETASTIDVEDMHGMTFYDIRLKASINGISSGIVTYPEIESNVLIGRIGNSNENLYLLKPDKIARLKGILGDVEASHTEFEIKATDNSTPEIRITTGEVENGALIISSKLIQEINTIIQDINGLKKAITNCQPATPPNDGGLALQISTTSWSSSTLGDTVADDVSNLKIMH